jgi:protein involved in polysaccharide export with SLBB domain
MKNKILLLLLTIFSLSTFSQNVDATYLKFLPSNANPADLRPSDIPSEQVMIQMGLTNDEIQQALNFKNSNGDYSSKDTSSNSVDKVNLFYKNLGNVVSHDSLSYPRAKIYGQDIFRKNEINFFQNSTNATAPSNYEIGSGDELSITVWGNSDYSTVVIVDEKGYISPSGFGRIYVKGLSLKNTKLLIRKKLGMNNSDMDVSLIYSRVIIVNIVGEVYNPGSYAIPAINTAFNALMISKGPTQIGSVRNIYIKRNGEVVDSLDVYQFLFNPKNTNDIYLQDGDYIVVSAASNLVEVSGEVNRPYTYEVKSTDNMEDLIQYAGGYTSDASKNIVTLKRFENEFLLLHDVHINDLSSTYLESADELIVNKLQRKTSNYISLEGSIGVEGDYEFMEGETLFELLKRANCIGPHLYTTNAYVLRLQEDRTRKNIRINLNNVLEDQSSDHNITLQEYDIITVMSVEDFDDDYFVEVFGSVRNAGTFIYGKGLNLSDVINLSGGIKQEASGSRIEVSRVLEINNSKISTKRSVVLIAEINEDLSLKSEFNNFELHENDQIFIRKNPDYKDPVNITISGEVKYPGTYALLSEGDRISDVIERCGGLTTNAFSEGVKLYRKTEVLEKKKHTNSISEDFKNVILSDTSLYNMYSEDLLKSELNELSTTVETGEFEYTVVSFNLDNALNVSSKHNIILLEGDSLVIPKSVDVVYVTGDLLNYEGSGISVPYFEMKRANYYVNNFAGGYSKENNKNRTLVVYPNGSVKRSVNYGLFSLSPKVKRGSIIKLMSKEEIQNISSVPLDWNVVIEKTLVKMTGVMSLYLLLDRIQGSF